MTLIGLIKLDRLSSAYPGRVDELVFREGMASYPSSCVLSWCRICYQCCGASRPNTELELMINLIGGTVLHYAALQGSASAAEVMLRRGAAVDRPNAEGRTPLMLATMSGHHEVVQLLLAHGARTDAMDIWGRDVQAWATLRKFASIGELIQAAEGPQRSAAQAAAAGGSSLAEQQQVAVQQALSEAREVLKAAAAAQDAAEAAHKATMEAMAKMERTTRGANGASERKDPHSWMPWTSARGGVRVRSRRAKRKAMAETAATKMPAATAATAAVYAAVKQAAIEAALETPPVWSVETLSGRPPKASDCRKPASPPPTGRVVSPPKPVYALSAEQQRVVTARKAAMVRESAMVRSNALFSARHALSAAGALSAARHLGGKLPSWMSPVPLRHGSPPGSQEVSQEVSHQPSPDGPAHASPPCDRPSDGKQVPADESRPAQDAMEHAAMMRRQRQPGTLRDLMGSMTDPTRAYRAYGGGHGSGGAYKGGGGYADYGGYGLSGRAATGRSELAYRRISPYAPTTRSIGTTLADRDRKRALMWAMEDAESVTSGSHSAAGGYSQSLDGGYVSAEKRQQVIVVEID